MSIARDQNGRFTQGNPGGPGRPKRETERLYLDTITSVVSLESWQAIIERAVSDAKLGDARARDWLSRYLIGEKVISGINSRPRGEIVFYTPDNRRRVEDIG